MLVMSVCACAVCHVSKTVSKVEPRYENCTACFTQGPLEHPCSLGVVVQTSKATQEGGSSQSTTAKQGPKEERKRKIKAEMTLDPDKLHIIRSKVRMKRMILDPSKKYVFTSPPIPVSRSSYEYYIVVNVLLLSACCAAPEHELGFFYFSCR